MGKEIERIKKFNKYELQLLSILCFGFRYTVFEILFNSMITDFL